MAQQIYMKQWDTHPPVTARLRDGAGTPASLDGASVVFSIGNGLVTRQPAVVTGPGVVTYSWSEGDTAIPGSFSAEFQATYSDGKVETFPRRQELTVTVEDRTAVAARLGSLAVAAAQGRLALVTAAFGETTNNRWLDIDGDGVVAGADISSATSAAGSMAAAAASASAERTAFGGVPQAIQELLDTVITTGTGNVEPTWFQTFIFVDDAAAFAADGVLAGDSFWGGNPDLPAVLEKVASVSETTLGLTGSPVGGGSEHVGAVDGTSYIISRHTLPVVSTSGFVFPSDLDGDGKLDGKDLAIAKALVKAWEL